jgi:hypothetical protein
MNEIDYFTYCNKINFLKHEVELIVTKQEEINSAVKRVYGELEELSQFKPDSFSSQENQNIYHEPGNEESQTPLEKIGDGG